MPILLMCWRPLSIPVGTPNKVRRGAAERQCRGIGVKLAIRVHKLQQDFLRRMRAPGRVGQCQQLVAVGHEACRRLAQFSRPLVSQLPPPARALTSMIGAAIGKRRRGCQQQRAVPATGCGAGVSFGVMTESANVDAGCCSRHEHSGTYAFAPWTAHWSTAEPSRLSAATPAACIWRGASLWGHSRRLLRLVGGHSLRGAARDPVVDESEAQR